MIQSFLNESIVKRAQEKGLVEIDIVNLRDFATDSYKTVDDRPYGGGAGMVIKVDVVSRALESLNEESIQIFPQDQLVQNSSDIKQNERQHSVTQNSVRDESGLQTTDLRQNLKDSSVKIILMSAKGKGYSQSIAEQYSKLNHLVVIAGHYEGFDARVEELVDEQISVGDFVLTGGEIPAAAIVDSVVRLIPGVLKKEKAPKEESFFRCPVNRLIDQLGEDEILQRLKEKGVTEVSLVEYPQYTRPEDFNGSKVPTVLLSGNHAEIEKWRLKQAYEETKKRRPDLLAI